MQIPFSNHHFSVECNNFLRGCLRKQDMQASGHIILQHQEEKKSKNYLCFLPEQNFKFRQIVQFDVE